MASLDGKLDHLARVPLFSRLRHGDLERVGQLAEEVDVPAGKVLIRQGESAQEFLIVVEGRVRIERDEKLLAVRGPGEFFGEIALVAEGPRTATVVAETPCRLLVLGHREFHALMDDQPGVERAILEALAERVGSLLSDPTAR